MSLAVIFFSLYIKRVFLNTCLQMKYMEIVLKAKTSALDLSRKGHIEEGAADSSWTGLEGSEHRTNTGDAGAPSAPPFTASFMCFWSDSLQHPDKAFCSGGGPPAPPRSK